MNNQYSLVLIFVSLLKKRDQKVIKKLNVPPSPALHHRMAPASRSVSSCFPPISHPYSPRFPPFVPLYSDMLSSVIYNRVVKNCFAAYITIKDKDLQSHYGRPAFIIKCIVIVVNLSCVPSKFRRHWKLKLSAISFISFEFRHNSCINIVYRGYVYKLPCISYKQASVNEICRHAHKDQPTRLILTFILNQIITLIQTL